MMDLTKHARKRMRQRGFSDLTLAILLEHGRCERAPGGATRVVYGKKEYQRTIQELKRAIQKLDKARGGAIIIDKLDSEIITVYRQ